MTPAEDKLAAALQMSQTVRELALAGIRARFPDAGTARAVSQTGRCDAGPGTRPSRLPGDCLTGSIVSGDLDPIDVALRVTAVLDTLGVSHTVGGSIAQFRSPANRARRSTSTWLRRSMRATSWPAWSQRCQDEFYLDETALSRAVREHSAANLIHHATSIKIDLFVAGGTPLDLQQIARRAQGRDWRPHVVRASAGRHPAAEAALVSQGRRGLRPPVARRARHRAGAGRRAAIAPTLRRTRRPLVCPTCSNAP